MGFTASLLGLDGERVSSKFGTMRGSCPHKGTDFTSSKKPKPFKAGVFGKVVAPLDGKWGTITVIPFNEPTSRIQYLHCSKIKVKVGSIVTPWTVIGETGETAPPGRSRGIHLHLQIVTTGKPPNDCWDGRNFSDPEKFDTHSSILGLWYRNSSATSGGIRKELRSSIDILADISGASAPAATREIHTIPTGCQFVMSIRHPSAKISSRTNNGLIWSSGKGRVDECFSTCNTRAACRKWRDSGELRMISQNQLLVVRSGVIFTRSGVVESPAGEPR